MYIHNSAVPHCMAAQPWISSIAIPMKYYLLIAVFLLYTTVLL